MFWNGFTDIFWMAPSVLFDPLLLFLWLFLTFLHRKELKNLSFIWPLGLAVLLNNFLHFSHFSDLLTRSVLLQSENHSLLIQIVGFLSNLLTSIGWGIVLWKLLLNNQHRNYWMILFVLFSIPVLFFWESAMLFFNGLPRSSNGRAASLHGADGSSILSRGTKCYGGLADRLRQRVANPSSRNG